MSGWGIQGELPSGASNSCVPLAAYNPPTPCKRANGSSGQGMQAQHFLLSQPWEELGLLEPGHWGLTLQCLKASTFLGLLFPEAAPWRDPCNPKVRVLGGLCLSSVGLLPPGFLLFPRSSCPACSSNAAGRFLLLLPRCGGDQNSAGCSILCPTAVKGKGAWLERPLATQWQAYPRAGQWLSSDDSKRTPTLQIAQKWFTGHIPEIRALLMNA